MEMPDRPPPTPTPAQRQAFLDHRRRVTTERYDTRFADGYDEDWGRIMPSHAAMLARLLEATVAGGEVLDVPCGTGKYWPAILASGRRVVGADQSAGMLAQASRKSPDVPVRRLALQELDEHARYDALICVDALENVGPEDWPPVLGRLREALRPGAPIYLTSEIPEPGEAEAEFAAARARGEPVVPGEALGEDGGYHFFPGKARVLDWITRAGLRIDDVLEGDHYLHVLAHRPEAIGRP
jgi:cyclopropane fatty-acyl-phospholipid synthase-like methyltransferase